MHGFVSRDGCDPAELRRIGREQLSRYPSVETRGVAVVGASRVDGGGFEVHLGDGDALSSRLLLLATGVTDDLLAVPGADELFGRGVYHCPCCDSYEAAAGALVAYGRGAAGLALALELRCWSDDVLLSTDGPASFESTDHERLRANRIGLDERPIVATAEGARAAFAVNAGLLRAERT